MGANTFISRHNGPRLHELSKMFETIGVSSLDQLIEETVPAAIRLKKPLNIPNGISEYEYLQHIKGLASKNKIFRSYIGLGYYNTATPSVIIRNILENPSWYTSYTPYQAEISQGRLEALLNFQTMVSDLTGLPIANASLLDESTAAAESMTMFFGSRSREQVKNNVKKFFVSEDCLPQNIDVLATRALPLNIELVVGKTENFTFTPDYFGALVQYPNQYGEVINYTDFVKKSHDNGIFVAVAADIMSLVLLTPPGEFDADVALGSTQRFGIPMGFGGPHAAYFATKESFKRNIPGRIIGISVDRTGKRALRMALQTREQHIKRERATSNICTSQALLATMAGMYAIYHGADGVKTIARKINILTGVLNNEVKKYGYTQENTNFFDTLKIKIPASANVSEIKNLSEKESINFRYIDTNTIGISVDETTTLKDINDILRILATANKQNFVEFVCVPSECEKIATFQAELKRSSCFLTQSVFNTYHSETEMVRYIKRLEIKDLSMTRSMIPLGSCTMKLNAATEMFSLSWPEFGAIHPFVPTEQAAGYHEMISELEKMLCEVTGFAAVSFQPNSGAAGEYTGLMVIREHHIKNGQGHRNICLIPASAHGTNPASAVMAGMNVVVVKCDANGNIDVEDLKLKIEQHKDNLAAFMVTYPSTHGVFEETILEVIELIHKNGGQVYMDGANMNAQVGLTNPGTIGADVCHLNLHKTFAIPHGGGGPGVGPIAVAAHLKEYLPGHSVVKTGGNQAIKAVSAAPYGSASVLTISYAYLKLAGGDGLTLATKYAILNANYLKTKLEPYYPILYVGKNGRCAHEMILDCNAFSRTAGVQVIDIAKRLMDYGFHAPTVAFPVHGTLMVEPTESEPVQELDRFIEAMAKIRAEITEIENGNANKANNVIINAPHTIDMVISGEWNYPYSREVAVMPVHIADKYWPTVAKIDDAFGDRNLVCTCEPIENY